jgi:hypothetical protein
MYGNDSGAGEQRSLATRTNLRVKVRASYLVSNLSASDAATNTPFSHFPDEPELPIDYDNESRSCPSRRRLICDPPLEVVLVKHEDLLNQRSTTEEDSAQTNDLGTSRIGDVFRQANLLSANPACQLALAGHMADGHGKINHELLVRAPFDGVYTFDQILPVLNVLILLD